MPPLGNSTHNSFCRLLGGLAVAAVVTATAQADVIHKYTFNANTAADSVGGADGTVIDATGISSYTGGALNLTANNGITSGALNTVGAAGAYVDLQNDILTNAVANTTGNGAFGQATIEMWLTVQQNRPWAEAFVFGASTGGEGISDNGDGQSYIALIPQSGPNDFRGTTRSPTAETPIIGSPAPLAVNQRHHVVMVLDGLDQTAGPGGTVSLYLNNGAAVTGAIQPFIDTMTNNNNWLGRSLFGGDALFDGLIDEFSIYNHALSNTEVAANFAQGPVAAPVPTLVVNRDTGEVRIANQSAGNIDLKGYTISSAAGALNPSGWTSIDAGNQFDGNGVWTPTGPATNLQIAESVTSGTLDGGTLTPTPTPNSSRTIGSAWLETPFQDLTFAFTLGDNSTGTGQVQYIGSAALRSDFNGDELINAADWTTFKNNSYTSLAGLPAAQAYLKGDLDGDLDNDFQDFRLFKADFIAASGEAAFAALVGAVPEPATFTLAAAAAAILLGASRRRN